MINVSEVVSDPDFAESFTIKRSSGTFVLGGFASTPSIVSGFGVIRTAVDKDLKMLPEGDRVRGAIVIHTAQPLFLTRADPPGLADIVTWHGDDYRLESLDDASDFGYYKGIALRIVGD